jgi:DNA polymerase III alpha subunit (gram-positive type)
MKNSEVYVSCDIEADGPLPSDNSMLSLGAAAFTPDGNQIGTFYINLEEAVGAKPDPDTMEWWSKNQEAYDATRQNLVEPKLAMEQFVAWVNGLPGKPVFVGYPAGFDFLFVYFYIVHYGFKSPFSFSALDIKTYASAMLKLPYRESTKKNMPKRWFSDAPHTHNALDDSIEQGQLFINMLKENTGS